MTPKPNSFNNGQLLYLIIIETYETYIYIQIILTCFRQRSTWLTRINARVITDNWANIDSATLCKAHLCYTLLLLFISKHTLGHFRFKQIPYSVSVEHTPRSPIGVIYCDSRTRDTTLYYSYWTEFNVQHNRSVTLCLQSANTIVATLQSITQWYHVCIRSIGSK